MDDIRLKIKIDSDTKELVITRQEFGKMAKEIRHTSDASQTFGDKFKGTVDVLGKGTLAAFGLVAVFNQVSASMRGVVDRADSWKLVEGRLGLVSDSTKELVDSQRELFVVAQDTHQLYGNTADLYARIARSTKELNKSMDDHLIVTETINKSLIVSGSSATESDAAITQLGQGFASGALRGEELNSVMEQTPRLAQAIAEGMGKTIGELRDMGAAGELTAAKVYDAIKSQADVIDKEFNRMPVVVGQSLTNISNSITKFVGKADRATGASSAIANGFMSMAKSIDEIDIDQVIELAGVTASVAVAVGGLKVASLAYAPAAVIVNNLLLLQSQLGTSAAAAQMRHVMSLQAGAIASRSFAIAMKTIPLVAVTLAVSEVTAAMIGAESPTQTLFDLFTDSTKSVKEYKDEMRGLSDAINDVSLSTLNQQIAENNAQMNKIAKQYSDVRIAAQDSGYQYLDAQNTEIRNQIQAIKELVEERTKLNAPANQPGSGTGTSSSGAILTLDEETKKIIAQYESKQWWREQEAKGEKDLHDQKVKDAEAEAGLILQRIKDQQTVVALQEQNYRLITDMTGTNYDKWLLNTADAMQKLAAAGASNEDLGKYWDEALKSNDVESAWANFSDNASQTFADGLSNAIQSAVTDGDVMGAIQGMTSSMGSSLIQGGIMGVNPYMLAGGMAVSALGGLFGDDNKYKTLIEIIEEEKEAIDKQTEAITTRLDAQLGLLSVIGREGGAASIELETAEATYSGEMEKLLQEARLVFDFYSGFSQEAGKARREDLSPEILAYEEIFGDSLAYYNENWHFIGGQFESILDDSLEEVLAFFEEFEGAAHPEKLEALKNKYAIVMDEYAASMLGVASDIENATVRMKDLSDELAGTGFFKEQELERAKAKIEETVALQVGYYDRLRQGFEATGTYAGIFEYIEDANNFIQGVTESKEAFSDFLNDLILDLDTAGVSISGLQDALLSEDLNVQAEAVQTMQELLGDTMDISAKDAINLIDSIELVGNSFIDAAAAAEKAAEEAAAYNKMLESAGDYTRSISLYNAEDKTAMQKLFAQQDAAALSSLLGVSGVTLDNFNNLYAAMLNASPDEETIGSWQELGGTLMTLADLSVEVAEEIKQSTYDFMVTADEAAAAYAALGLYGEMSTEVIDNLKASLDGMSAHSDEYGSVIENIGYVETYLSSLDTAVEEIKQSTYDFMTTADEAATAYAALGLSGAMSTESIDALKASLDGLSVNSDEYAAVTENIGVVESYLSTITSDMARILSGAISDLESVSSTSKSAIKSIYGDAFATQNYKKYLLEAKAAQSLVIAEPSSADATSLFKDAVSGMSDSLSGYLDKSNFASQFDYDVARASAAHQFESFGDTADSSIDILESIQAATEAGTVQLESINAEAAAITQSLVNSPINVIADQNMVVMPVGAGQQNSSGVWTQILDTLKRLEKRVESIEEISEVNAIHNKRHDERHEKEFKEYIAV